MIRAVIFDFDGVIIESAQLKTEAFRKLFSQWPNKVDQIVSYHLKNMGVSRYVKIKYFYGSVLNEPYTEEVGAELGRQFSDIVLDEVMKAPFVKGTLNFLEKKYRDYLLFIASGTPESELYEIINYRDIKKYFTQIFGTPATKTAIIKQIMKRYSLQKDQVVFVGDAESDLNAARATGIPFILRITPENDHLKDSSKYMIDNLMQLEEQIGKVEEEMRN
ncbi:MAG: hypothetical protein CVU52_04845 [Deltaproteobacteria bacterium HGW-Deltaproteobacteria-10]|nr:MAG: hypothetical protein CVU52_04845 [Deltaproteobacteria bacterium HGW-Deltaproteobacteria-10]